MKTIRLDRSKLVRAVAQLTHAQVDATQWPSMVVFDPTEDAPTADVQLPDRINSQGGFDSLRRQDQDQPASTAGLPTPVTATPLTCVNLGRAFSWNDELPDANDAQAWERVEIRGVTDRIVNHLRHEVEIDGNTYKVEYY